MIEAKLMIQPVIAMLTLTLFVWVYMYILRLRFIFSNKIADHQLQTPEQLNQLIPASINAPSNNLKNLFELPVIFYVLAASIIYMQMVDTLYVGLAWAYVALRAIHSLIHCTLNKVLVRFQVYLLSSLVLWIMLGRFALQVI